MRNEQRQMEAHADDNCISLHVVIADHILQQFAHLSNVLLDAYMYRYTNENSAIKFTCTSSLVKQSSREIEPTGPKGRHSRHHEDDVSDDGSDR